MRAIPLLMLAFACQLLSAQEKLLPVFHFQRIEGLATGQIRSRTLRDHEGFVWVGTLNGLERFDGYSITDYRNDPDDPRSLPNNFVTALLLDSGKRLWVGTFGAGISLFDRVTERFASPLQSLGDTSWSRAKIITRIIEDRAGDLWLASRYAGVVRMEIPRGLEGGDPDSLLSRVRFTTFSLGTPLNTAMDLQEGSQGRILVASDSGFLVLDPGTRSISRITGGITKTGPLDSAGCECLCRDSRGYIWIGTKADGVFRIDSLRESIENFRHINGDTFSISSNRILDIAEDRTGDIWISGSAGLDLFSPSTGKRAPFLTVGRAPSGPTVMMSLSVDNLGTLWVGTTQGAYWLSQKSRAFPHYGRRAGNGPSPALFETIHRDSEGNRWFASDGVICQIDIQSLRVRKVIDVIRGKKPTYGDIGTLIDRNGEYWFGTWGLGLFRINLTTGQVQNYGIGSGLGKDLVVNSIAQAGGDSLWIAGHFDGLMKFHPVTGGFATVPGFPKCNVKTVQVDSRGMLWVSSQTHGVFLVDSASRIVQWLHHDPSDARSLASDHGRAVFEDPSGRIWIGAGKVLHLWDPRSGSVIRYANPASAEAVFAAPIGSDFRGRIWIDFLYGGLAAFDPSTGIFRNFGESDGLSINVNQMDTLADGRLVVTTDEGLHVFHPDSVGRERTPPPLVITRMSVNDESIPRPRMADDAPYFSLSYSQNVLEFEFAALEIDAPHLVGYQYQLEGLEEEWVKPQGRRFVRYSSLAPGEYMFKVRATSSEGEWAAQELAMAISIAPPWWRTSWAYAVYFLVVAGALYSAYHIRLRGIRSKQRADMEHMRAEHLEEMDHLKSRFFANVSHEFRTPITLIMGPAAQLLERSNDEETRAHADIIHRAAQKLNRLVGELLDISKIEAGEMKLKARPLNIVSIVDQITRSFQPLAERKKISFGMSTEEREVIAYADKGKLDKILSNVLSNAFKFTPEGGSVTIEVKRHQPGSSPPYKEGSAEISVRDSGIGIPRDQIDRIFDRFYQVDSGHTREHEGTGIGLSLTRDLMELHKGSIEVDSEEGRGSTFRLIIPLGKGHLKAEEINDGEEDLSVGAQDDVPELRDERTPGFQGSVKPELPSLLVIEDNPDVRKHISMILRDQYQIVEAGDGQEGLDRAYAAIPDLIISDVMMPKLDGFQLCSALKTDIRTSHIPLILLTAKATTGDKVSGLEVGADDYIMKPFDASELKARIRNLLEQRRRLHDHFRRDGFLAIEGEKITSADEKFLRKAASVIQEHLSDASFSVEAFSERMAVSRSVLFRKTEALLGEAPSEMIKRIRLQRAATLIQARASNISEIALEVGFNNPSYFAECFRRQFGVSPTQYVHNSAISPAGQAGSSPK